MKNFKVYKLIFNSARKQEQGSVMVITVILSAFLFAILILYMLFAESIQKFSKADTQNLNAFSAAAGALAERSDAAITALRANPNALKNTVLQASTPFNCLRADSVNTGATACKNFQPESSVIEGVFRQNEVESKKVAEGYNGYTAITDNTKYSNYAQDKLRWDRLSTVDNFGGAISKSYVYTIGSLGIKQDGGGNTRAQSILQSNIQVRNIPIFQFDRFNFGSDTIVVRNTGGAETYNGRYHSNGDLTIINNTPNAAVLAGRWTVSGNVNSTAGSNYVSLPTGFSLLPTASPVPYASMYNYTTMLKFAGMGMKPLLPPNSELLKPKDTAGNLQDLYGKAHLRITRRNVANNRALPLQLTAIESGSSARGGTCTDLASDREDLASTKCQVFTKGMLVSLLQPVLVRNPTVAEQVKYCKVALTPTPAMTGYSPAIRAKILRAVQIVLSTNQSNRYNLSAINTVPLSDNLYQLHTQADLSTMLGNIHGIIAATIPALASANIQELAAASGGCFLAPPIQIPVTAANAKKSVRSNIANPSFRDRRENKLLTPLQINLESLAVWNRDGIYAEFPSENLDTAEQVPAANLISLLNSSSTTDGYLWVRTPADSTKVNTLVESGLGAASLIIHNTTEIDSAFIYNGAKNLPAPTSIVSDSALYLQGDWNAVNKQPSAAMADTITLLSNNCLATADDYPNGSGIIPNGQVNCGVGSGMNLAADTTFNTAILSGLNPITAVNTDSTPIRYLEDWTNKSLTLKTSLVISGVPKTSTSNFVAPGTGAYGNSEYFRYPTTINMSLDPDFSEPAGLPPGTPMAIDIIEDSINRKFREGEEFNIQKNMY